MPRQRSNPGFGSGPPRYPGSFLLTLRATLAELNWHIQRWLGYAVVCVDEQGRENTKSFRTQKMAQGWLDEVIAAQVTGTYVAPKAGRITVEELRAKWLGTQGHLKETTVVTRAYTWTCHVELRWAHVAVADVQTSAVRSWVQDMVTAGAGNV